MSAASRLRDCQGPCPRQKPMKNAGVAHQAASLHPNPLAPHPTTPENPPPASRVLCPEHLRLVVSVGSSGLEPWSTRLSWARELDQVGGQQLAKVSWKPGAAADQIRRGPWHSNRAAKSKIAPMSLHPTDDGPGGKNLMTLFFAPQYWRQAPSKGHFSQPATSVRALKLRIFALSNWQRMNLPEAAAARIPREPRMVSNVHSPKGTAGASRSVPP